MSGITVQGLEDFEIEPCSSLMTPLGLKHWGAQYSLTFMTQAGCSPFQQRSTLNPSQQRSKACITQWSWGLTNSPVEQWHPVDLFLSSVFTFPMHYVNSITFRDLSMLGCQLVNRNLLLCTDRPKEDMFLKISELQIKDGKVKDFTGLCQILRFDIDLDI